MRTGALLHAVLAALFLFPVFLFPSPLSAAEKMDLWDKATGPHLRGVDVHQRRVYPELDGPTFLGPAPFGPPFVQADFDRLAALGANVVVVSHPGLFTEKPPYRLDPAAKANLDRLLAMIGEADMFAVIAFRTGPGRSEFTMLAEGAGDWFDESYFNDRVWAEEAARKAWVDMWRATARAYGNNPIVVGYELMVEPNSNEMGSGPDDRLDIWEPEEFERKYAGSPYDWNVLHPRIAAAVREEDPDTPILVGGNGYSALAWLPFLKDTGQPRTVYTAHQYAPHAYTHQDADAGVPAPVPDLSPLERENRPLAVTEFGAHRWAPDADRFLAGEIAAFERLGLNAMLWTWFGSVEEYNREVNAFNFRFGPAPGNTSDRENAVLSVVRDWWARNTKRPSNTPFHPP